MLSNLFKKKKSITDRRPRIRLILNEEHIFKGSDGESYQIVNLSESGTGLLSKSPLKNKIDIIQGSMVIAGKNLPTSLKVVHQSGAYLGCKFSELSSELRRAIVSNFQLEFSALEMKEVSANHLKISSEGKPKWFFSPNNFELFFSELNGEITSAETSLHGKIMQFSKGNPPKFGILSNEHRDEPSHSKADLIQWQQDLDPMELKNVVRVIENILELTKDEKQQLLKLITA